MTDSRDGRVGFIGLGTMGEPMALNLARAGTPLIVWNRTAGKARSLAEAGAAVAADAAEVFERAGTVVLMLFDGEAVDAILGRGTPAFDALVAGHLVINMGSPSPAYSRGLERDLRAAGARYVEAPVSGQKALAQAGRLVVLLAGDPEDASRAERLLAPLCRATVACGAVPGALAVKHASNVYVTSTQICLAEAVHCARALGADLAAFSELMTAGPMSSEILRLKLPKLVERDFAVQASLAAAADVTRLALESAGEVGAALPVLALVADLLAEARPLGDPAGEDAVSAIRAIERRSSPGQPRRAAPAEAPGRRDVGGPAAVGSAHNVDAIADGGDAEPARRRAIPARRAASAGNTASGS